MTQQHDRLSDELLSHVAGSKHYGNLLQKIASELIERRKAEKYVQHLPGCKRMSDPVLDGRYFQFSECTCGLSKLPAYVRGDE